MKKRHVARILGCTLAFAASPAAAYDWVIAGKVTTIEVTYMPGAVVFAIDTPAGTCATGSFLRWNSQGADTVTKAANAQAVLSVLLTAKASGQVIRIYGNNTGCTIDYIHLP